MKQYLQRLWNALRARPIIGVAVAASALGAFYWSALASDRFVSEAHVIVQRSDLAGRQGADISSLFGLGSSGSKVDELLLADHLLSVDMLKKLDAQLRLREHYSDSSRDLLSRMWFKDASLEWFHDHYRSRVRVEMDDYTGVLVIKAQAYEPAMAHAITAALVQEGERFMNGMAHRIAQGQVSFLEKQVTSMSDRALRARHAVLAFQNSKGLVSPQATAETISAIVGRLQAQRTELQTQQTAMQAYLVAAHPTLVQIGQQINALDRQIAVEERKLAAPSGKTLNRTVEEFQRLELEASFAQDVYKTALSALEQGRIEATRTIKQVSVIQAPTQPQYPLEPRRIYNTVVFILTALLLAGVAHLLAAIVRDHKD
jgi:capsular polysaccharide transport system permease protein